MKIACLAFFLRIFPVSISRKLIFRLTRFENLKTVERRRIFVDVSLISTHDARTGIQRVVRAVLIHMRESLPLEYSLYFVAATRKAPYRLVEFGPRSNDEHESLGLDKVECKAGDIFFGLDFAPAILSKHAKQLLDWKLNGARIVFVVYDLLPLNKPSWFTSAAVRNFLKWIRTLALYSDGLITISHGLKSQLESLMANRFQIVGDSLSIDVVRPGADILQTSPSTGLPSDFLNKTQFFKSSKTILMVGTLEPRKGHDQCLSAFEQLWTENFDGSLCLLFVGKSGWKMDSFVAKLVSHKEFNKRLFWIDDASDEYLTHLYNACAGVLVASRAEGFGLPIVEAARAKKRILARDIPVFREINAPGVSYFSGSEPHSLAKSIKNWIVEIEEDPADFVWNDVEWRSTSKQIAAIISRH